MRITTISSAPGWWLLIGGAGLWQRRPLAGWALLADGTVRGLTDWLADAPKLVDGGEYRHEVDFLPCSCTMPTPHSGGFDPDYCLECGGVGVLDR